MMPTVQRSVKQGDPCEISVCWLSSRSTQEEEEEEEDLDAANTHTRTINTINRTDTINTASQHPSR